ncbi:tagaturonate reductase [Brevibacillus humidisoli]|uniref:tagaturonate reductase n=1 Tax=Brevibacillus humidisoli TaxID=2895522 RepID=UPI001E4474B2|nr:tagaturonate reductase [Brevibacillus humidisoli]UFJ40292.1 tagaturonate reductase [Brevibacillus humidisoli]
MEQNLPVLNRESASAAAAKELDYTPHADLPERVLQIGEGNFLRGFIDWMIHEMNKQGLFRGRVAAIQPTPRGKVVPKLNRQDGLYTLILRGMEQGRAVEKLEVIDSISRGINPYENWSEALQAAESPSIEFLISNTTEAGLQFLEEPYDPDQSPLSFPGKLVALLYHRYQHFRGAPDRGWIILPCELVEENGAVLKQLCQRVAVYWQLPDSFLDWVETSCVFCNTLVDRIVTGYPHSEAQRYQERLGYRDELLTAAEPYHLFVIEGPQQVQQKLPFDKAGLRVYFDRIDDYRELKVKLLNAPHTLMAAVAFLGGATTVKEAVEDPLFKQYVLDVMTEEITATLRGIDRDRALCYIDDVLERFANPYLHHRLLDISLNGVSKFQTRVLPSLLAYREKKGQLPRGLVFGLAALLAFYRPKRIETDRYIGERDGGEYEIRDHGDFLQKMEALWKDVDQIEPVAEQVVAACLAQESLWGHDLTQVDGLVKEVAEQLVAIEQHGIRAALQESGWGVTGLQ